MDHSKDISAYTTVAPFDHEKGTDDYVHHSEVPLEPDMGPQPPSHRSFIVKLGLWNAFVLISGAVASFLAMAFLAFLWAGSETARKGDRTPALWFHIVDNGWATRVVTVASVLIRLATAAQMGVFAALMAAWTLETTGASAEHLPMLSIIRTVNNGPQSHVWNVLHSIRIGTRPFYSLLVVLAILDALALQFTSTLLITDFRSTTIVPGKTFDWVSYSARDPYDAEAGSIQAGNGVDFFQSGPAAYARFAEMVGQSHAGADYDDTGTTLRAFLPFGASETRSLLRGYDGPAMLIDSRIRCGLPSMAINNVSSLVNSAGDGTYEIAIAGQVGLQGLLPGQTADGEDSDSDGSFLMTAVARTAWANSTDWRLSYALALHTSGFRGFSDSVLDPFDTGSVPLLLMNVTGDGWQSTIDEALENLVNNNVSVPEQIPFGPFDWEEAASGIWTNLRPSNVTADIGLSATLCFANLRSSSYSVHVDGGADFSEPKNMPWVAESKTFDTTMVRRMLGTHSKNLSLQDRGILELHAPSDGNWTTQLLNDNSSEFVTAPLITGLSKLVSPQLDSTYRGVPVKNWGASAAFTPFSAYNGVHKTHAALFQDVIQSTLSPALAFQAFFTVIAQMTYYDQLPQFDIGNTATFAVSQRVDVPNQWLGFGVVTGLLGLHAVLVGAAVVLFLRRTRHSLLGNAWQAVAQVSSADTRETVRCASNMTDREVGRMLRMGRCEGGDVVLRTGADGATSQAVYRRGEAW